jgi:hypothetical protein
MCRYFLALVFALSVFLLFARRQDISPADRLDSRPTMLAQETRAKIGPSESEYVHQWVATDGSRFVMVNRDPLDPLDKERALIENEFAELNDAKSSQDIDSGLSIGLDNEAIGLAKSEARLDEDELRLLSDQKATPL